MLQALDETRGRRHTPHYVPIEYENPFLDDEAQIRNSQAYRRLAGKTQVFTRPSHTHVRTRASHTTEVVTAAVAIASQLGLNVSLCRAIAEGHDIGHLPFGHAGEEALSEALETPVRHAVLSLIIAQHVERHGKGLNLMYETLEGILYHSSGEQLEPLPKKPAEYSVVRYADKIAYIIADVADARREGMITNVPFIDNWGERPLEQTARCIDALVKESRNKGSVSFAESEIAQQFHDLRGFMFEKVYQDLDEEQEKDILRELYEAFLRVDETSMNPAIAVALLTDNEAYNLSKLLKKKKLDWPALQQRSIGEIIPRLQKAIDIIKPDLSWGAAREPTSLSEYQEVRITLR